jgi:phosphopantothenoylcysteine decarboxylase / phosphopantothenate---cysteine ligase
MNYDLTEKRRVVLGITGSIAAYKAAEVARQLVSYGYEVRCVITEAGQKFITPTTMGGVTGNSVVTDFWETESPEIGHIDVASWAEVIVVAPATADFIAKLVAGFADSPLLAICLATKAPMLIAPAMNTNMYLHPKTQENIQILRSRGISFVEPEEGELACGTVGVGRLADPQEIFYHTRRIMSRGDFKGKKILIAAGPTREPIDPVRYITNRSSGKMGVAIAREAFRRGAEVTVVHGPLKSKLPKTVESVEVVTAEEMFEEMMKRAFPERGEGPEAVIMAAAVADFRPKIKATQKIKKSNMPEAIELVKNPDILLALGEKRNGQRNPLLIGFAVETGEIEDLLAEARTKLERKHCDLIVGNFAQDAFDLDTDRVWLVDKTGRQEEVSTTYKSRIANKILDRLLKL